VSVSALQCPQLINGHPPSASYRLAPALNYPAAMLTQTLHSYRQRQVNNILWLFFQPTVLMVALMLQCFVCLLSVCDVMYCG